MLTIEEQEFNILHSRGDKHVDMYVSDTLWMRKMDRLVKDSPEYYQCLKEHTVNGEVVGKEYRFPVKLLTFRKSPAVSKLTEEQKKAGAERLRLWREKEKSRKLSADEEEEVSFLPEPEEILELEELEQEGEFDSTEDN